jgi:TatD DNase family protein
MIKYIDAHCHLSQPPAELTVGAFYNAARQSDWNQIVCVTDDRNNTYGAIGVHPWYVSEITDDWEIKLQDLLRKNPELFVGEIGLDKHKPDMETQTKVFCNQLLLAHELNRGVCMHCVGTWDKVLNIFKVFQNKLPHVILSHCYSGPAQDIKRLGDKYNMYFSYGPRNLQDMTRLHATPLDRIVAETDGYNPNDIISVVNRISVALDIAPEKMADIIYQNTMRMLKK